jgi:CMP/dCMP kinase
VTAKTPIAVAIDGPAGVGKSTVARALAKRLDALYVSSGLVYRATAWGIVQDGITAAQAGEVTKWLRTHRVSLAERDGEARVEVDGRDVTDILHTPEISEFASHVAAIPAVREALLACQRRFAETQSVVMEGRDIGTVVLPDAAFKFYLDAGEETRARRRYDELRAKGLAQEHPLVEESLRARDALDSTRSASPLVKAKDAVYVDTTALDAGQVVEALLKRIRA